MAKFSFTMPDDFIEQLNKCSNIDKIAPKMIDEATPIVVDSIKNNLANHKNSGDLDKSVKAKKAEKGKYDGYYGRVYFAGYGSTKEKVPNALKAVALEYGTVNQVAEPFMDKSVNDVEKQVMDTMQEVFNREVGG